MAGKPIAPRTLVLSGLLVAAAVTLAVTIWPNGTADTPVSSPQGPRDPSGAPADPAVPPKLGLEEMAAERPTPANRRDLFRFGAAQPEPAAGDPAEGQTPQPGRGAGRGAPPPVEGPVLPPAPPPIPLRLVGLAETRAGKVASLSDGKFTYYAREGETVEGRWRVVKIGAESVVIERVDGTGRQTLRLQGGTE